MQIVPEQCHNVKKSDLSVDTCSVNYLERPVPDMTYNVFGGTLSLNQSITLKDSFLI